MTYGDLWTFLERCRPEILRLAQLANALIDANELAPSCAASIPFWSSPLIAPLAQSSPLLEKAILSNMRRMRQVRRRSGEPYATHPLRVALIAYESLKEHPCRIESAILATIHDYLEEGDGLNAPALARMREQFPEAIANASVLLSEPQLDYQHFPYKKRFSEGLAYVTQVRLAATQPLANASLCDKIDNLHDMRYITADTRLSETRRRDLLCDKLAYFAFVLNEIGPFAARELSALLTDSLLEVGARLDIPQNEVAARRDAYLKAYAAHPELQLMIRAYHQRLGLSLAA